MVVCDVGVLQRSGTRVSRPVKKAKILTLEEWSRINNHLIVSNDAGPPEEDFKLQRIGVSNSRAEGINGDGAGVESVKRKNFDVKRNKNREEIIQKARDILFHNKDYVRRICHGLKLSSVLHERNCQIDFNRRLERERKVSEKERIAKLNEEIINYREELKRSSLKESEKAKSFRNALDEQLAEKIEKLKEDQSERVNERNYYVKMSRVSEEMAEEERLADLRKKQKFKEDFIRCWKAENEIRERLRAKDLEEEEMNRIYRDVAWEINAKRRCKENSRFKMKSSEGGAVEEPEIGNGSDREKKLKGLLDSRRIMKRALVDDLLKSREVYEKEVEKERENYKWERKISAARRKKKAEADEIRDRKEREERLKTMRNIMKFNLIQCMEKEEERRKEKELDVIYAPDFSRENKLINIYCEDIVRLMKKVKRPLFPVLGSVNEIKKEFGLERKTNEKFLKSNVPIGN